MPDAPFTDACAIMALVREAASELSADSPSAAPTLVISPADDVFVSPVNSDEMAAGIPGARLRRVSGGHAGMLEDHREILKVLQEFLSAEA